LKPGITTVRTEKRQNRAQRPVFAFQEPLNVELLAGFPVVNEVVLEQPTVTCQSCGSDIRAADESGLVNVLQGHLYEEHALEMPRERIRENDSAQLNDFDGYNARPISGT
jgi:hypothetical protein